MKKRLFLLSLLASGSAYLANKHLVFTRAPQSSPFQYPDIRDSLVNRLERVSADEIQSILDTAEQERRIARQETDLKQGFKHSERKLDIAELEQMEDIQVDAYLEKIRNFDADFLTDIHLDPEQLQILNRTVLHLDQLERFVGHGNFNLLGFDEALFFARNYESVGEFSQAELDFMEDIFARDATAYGFFGDKVITDLYSRVSRKDVIKISGSGHFLFRGESLNFYHQIYQDVGNQLLLTSGVRNVVKQMHLFLGKVQQSNGNLSKASRSLAPPGYSYHGIGDFDVGKTGLGERNFTTHFSTTEEFRRMTELGYVDIRYTDTNRFGVRYEPWHIKLS